jgi:hypothetical protein
MVSNLGIWLGYHPGLPARLNILPINLAPSTTHPPCNPNFVTKSNQFVIALDRRAEPADEQRGGERAH